MGGGVVDNNCLFWQDFGMGNWYKDVVEDDYVLLGVK